VAKYLVIPGVHQPTAPFELCINKGVWGKLSNDDKKLIELSAQLVTFETCTRIRKKDAKALDFFRKNGNEIVELDAEVQYAAHDQGARWADKTKAGNAWFGKVLQSQREFEALWKEAPRYRNVKVKQA
jgi:TRAP-type mannitol/chloroaromatic compound transport system substrate-binding protein